MEKKTTKKTISLDYIRGLIVAQGAKCAITGMALDPQEVNADHIIPLSRHDLNPSLEEDNFWLVHKKINSMKGSLTYQEFVEACKTVVDHQKLTEKLLIRIRERKIKSIAKAEFDQWVENVCDANGKLKSEKLK